MLAASQAQSASSILVTPSTKSPRPTAGGFFVVKTSFCPRAIRAISVFGRIRSDAGRLMGADRGRTEETCPPAHRHQPCEHRSPDEHCSVGGGKGRPDGQNDSCDSRQQFLQRLIHRRHDERSVRSHGRPHTPPGMGRTINRYASAARRKVDLAHHTSSADQGAVCQQGASLKRSCATTSDRWTGPAPASAARPRRTALSRGGEA